MYRIRVRMLIRLSRIALSEFETVGAGRVTSHFVTDLNAIDSFLGASVSGLVVSVLTLVGVAGVLFWMHWQLALFILLLNPVVILFSTRLGKRVKDLKKFENRAFEVFQDALAETLDALTQIRAMNREKHYLARVTDKAADIRPHAAAFAWKSDAMSRFSFFVFLVGFDAFRAGAMLMVVFSDLTIGEMLAVFGYLWFMMTPVQELVNMQYAWFAANAALGRINALLGLRRRAAASGAARSLRRPAHRRHRARPRELCLRGGRDGARRRQPDGGGGRKGGAGGRFRRRQVDAGAGAARACIR